MSHVEPNGIENDLFDKKYVMFIELSTITLIKLLESDKNDVKFDKNCVIFIKNDRLSHIFDKYIILKPKTDK